MKQTFALFRPMGCLEIAAIGVIVLAFAISQALGQGSSDSPAKNKKSKYAAMTEAPEKAREKRNPLEGDSQAIAAGGKLFEQHCAECHGVKAGGTRHGVSLLRDEVQEATPGTLFWILTNGVVRQGMPVWSKLPEPERWQLVTFLQSLRAKPANSPPRTSGTRAPPGDVKPTPGGNLQPVSASN